MKGKQTKIAVLCVAVLVLWGSLCGCAAEADYFAPFRGGFAAEVTGEMNGQPFSALLEAAPLPEEGERAVTVTFYAPEGLSGTVGGRRADGSLFLIAGRVTLGAEAAGLVPLLDLFPVTDAVESVTLTEAGHTRITASGTTVDLLPDGTPHALQTPTVTATVIRWEAR